MFEVIKMQDMKKVTDQSKGIFTAYRVFLKEGDAGQAKKYPVLLQWTTYLRAYALHSTKDSSIVNLFTKAGFDVYLVDFGDDTYFMPRGGTFAEYLQYALDVFDFVLGNYAQRKGMAQDQVKIHYFGVCEGSILAQVVSALRSEKLKSLSFNDLILNTENMGITSALMKELLLPMANTIPMKHFAQYFNMPLSVNAPFLIYSLYSPLGAMLMTRFFAGLPLDQLLSTMVWAKIDSREIELSHHIDYANVVYSNDIFKGRFKPKLPKEGEVEVKLNQIKAPIYSIIGGMDNFTEPGASFIERTENPFGTPYDEISQEIIPTGHNFWLYTSDDDNVRKKWLDWMKIQDSRNP